MADDVFPTTAEVQRNREEWLKLAAALEATQKNLLAATNPQTILKLSTQTKTLRDSMSGVNAEWKQMSAAMDEANKKGQSLGTTFGSIFRASGIGSFLGRQIGGLFGGIGGSVGGALGAVGGSVAGATKASDAGATGGAIALAVAPSIAGALKVGVGLITAGFTDLLSTLKTKLSEITGYVKFSDPGRIERLNMAFEDLYASIGASLVPIVDVAIVVIDQLNQVFSSLIPIVRPMMVELAGAFQQISNVVLAVLQPALQFFAQGMAIVVQELRPVFDDLMRLFAGIAVTMRQIFAAFGPQILAAFRTGLQLATSALMGFISALSSVLSFFGIQPQAAAGIAPEGPRSIAARPAQMISTEQIGEQARLTAFGSRGTQELLVDAMQQNNQELALNIDIMGTLQNALENLGQTIRNSLRGFVDGLLRLPTVIGDRISETFRNINWSSLFSAALTLANPVSFFTGGAVVPNFGGGGQQQGGNEVGGLAGAINALSGTVSQGINGISNVLQRPFELIARPWGG